MKKLYLPKPFRPWCLLFGGLALFSAWQLDDIYKNGVDNLPSLVDKQGNTASVDVAMQGLDAYEHLQKFHTLSIISLVLSLLLFTCYAFSMSQERR